MQNEINENPKVSICIPTYKQVEFLRRTLQSVSQQTFKNFELIISDDSPDDSVKNILNEFNFGNRLRYYKNSPSYGTPENWNKAIEKAKGEYIKILHHDDYFTYDFSLYKFVELLENNPQAEFGFSATCIWNISKNKKTLYKAPQVVLKKLKETPEVLFESNWIGAPSTTIYRSGTGILYDQKTKWLVDIDFYIQTLKKNKNFVFCPDPLITTPKGVAHQVTEDCKDNSQVELSEYFYLYKKHKDNSLSPKKLLYPLAKLFIKYKIDSIEDLKKLGIEEADVFVKEILSISKNVLNRANFKLEKIKNLLLQVDL